jgi:endonuclease/exonuclease/phosphatase (EEP) superfamily protein YafD
VRHILTLFFGLGLVALFLITFTGLLAPLFAPFDLINQLRLHLLETAVALTLVFVLLRARRLAMAAFALALINLVLAAPAFALTATVEESNPALKVVSLNVWGRKADPRRIEAFLRRENADIVLLIETNTPLVPMLDRLKGLYPYRVDCLRRALCRLVLLSKREMIEPRALPRGDANPPAVTARFNVEGHEFTFYGVHMFRPFNAISQRHDFDRLIAALGPIQGPLVLAGDFNTTPWSWSMTRLTLATGMVRGRSFGATWPAQRPFFPQFLIDHILVRGGTGIIEVRNGRRVGSDHLPIVAEISLP